MFEPIFLILFGWAMLIGGALSDPGSFSGLWSLFICVVMNVGAVVMLWGTLTEVRS